MKSIKMEKVKIMHETLCAENNLNIPLVFYTRGGLLPEGYTQYDTEGNVIQMGICKESHRKAGTLMHEWAHVFEKLATGESNDNPHTLWHEQKKVELMKRFNIKGLYVRFPDLSYFDGYPPEYPYTEPVNQ